jgi:hypothetical protein
MPVSAPSWRPSVQVGAAHTPDLQTVPDPQVHVMLPPQLSGMGPHWVPTPAQVYAVHPQTPPTHGPLEQSPSSEQALPGSQVGPQLPPQSTSLSAPFRTPSVHVADWHVFEKPWVLQTALTQSAPVPHVFASPHFGHCEPPQSTSVSEPSRVPLAHPGGTPPSELGSHCEPVRV